MKKQSRVSSKPQRVPTRKAALGPVSNLEEHLPSDWWRVLFNATYLKTDGDVVEEPTTTEWEVDTILKVLNLDTADRILDLCCGQGRHALELGRRGFSFVEGLDRSRYLIRTARNRAKKEDLAIRFREGDARKLPYPEDWFHAILILGNSFGYFEKIQDDLKVLKECRRTLTPGGQILLDIADGEYQRKHYQPRSWEWISKDYLVCRERSLSLDKQHLISREVVIHCEKGVIVDQFYSERLYDRETLRGLLESAGFVGIEFHDDWQTMSSRNQDLGMMASRFLVTARVPIKETIRRLYPAVKTVGVVMGDPTKKDPVKRNGQFNEEDFETVDRMKAALLRIEGYQFVFFNDHETLFHDLKTTRPDLVLNLCDEGYHNDPFKELHVPAMLEVLGIPYTGAGPACLGICYNKALVNAYAKSLGVAVPSETFIDKDESTYPMPASLPVIIKPNFGDSSFGITQASVVVTPEELTEQVSKLQSTYGVPVLVQEFLSGEEYSVGIIGNPPENYTVLPIKRVDYSGLDPELPRICGYEAKWHPDSPYWTQIKCRAAEDLPDEVEKNLVDWSLLLFERLGCRDYARFDFRCNARGEPKLLEVNPNPGWCWDGSLNTMAGFAGIKYWELFEMILKAAEERYRKVGNGNGNGKH